MQDLISYEGNCQSVYQYYREAISNQLWTTPGRLRAFNHFVFRDISFAGKAVLDVGGGTGRSSFYAAVRGARRVICLEPNRDGSTAGQLNKFDDIARRLKLGNIRLRTETFQDFQDEKGPFDVVLMLGSINHLDEWACIHLLEDQEAMQRYKTIFAKLAALCTKGADLIITDCAPSNLFARLGLKNPMAPTIEWHKHQPPEVWAGLLMAHGFNSPRVRWAAPNAFGVAGQKLLGNRLTAYFLRSSFLLQMRKE